MTIETITDQMISLETEIARQQSYILTHGEKNDSGEPDSVWQEYKREAAYNLDKWDTLKVLRDKEIEFQKMCNQEFVY